MKMDGGQSFSGFLVMLNWCCFKLCKKLIFGMDFSTFILYIYIFFHFARFFQTCSSRLKFYILKFCTSFCDLLLFSRIKIELHFSLIAAAVTYIMWKNVGNDKIDNLEGKSKLKENGTLDAAKKRRGYWRVDCQSASKGLFLGLLCLVGGIIILIIFFVMKDTPEFQDEMFWIFSGAELAILGLASIGCVGGFVQVQKLSHRYLKRLFYI